LEHQTGLTGLTGSDAISNAIDYAKFYSRPRDAAIRVYDESGNVIETHEHKDDLRTVADARGFRITDSRRAAQSRAGLQQSLRP
jgi:hypothetical protein